MNNQKVIKKGDTDFFSSQTKYLVIDTEIDRYIFKNLPLMSRIFAQIFG